MRLGAITGGHRPLPGPDGGECRGRPGSVAGPSVRVPLRRGRDFGGNGPVIFVLADVYMGDRVGWRWTTGVVSLVSTKSIPMPWFFGCGSCQVRIDFTFVYK